MRGLSDAWNAIVGKLGLGKRRNQRTSACDAISQRRLRVEALEYRRMLAVLTVNSFADTHINTDGMLTLREAIEVVNQASTNGLDNTTIQNQINGSLNDPNTIQFNLPSGQEILLNRSLGHLDIAKSLKIDAGNLSNGVIVNANDPSPGQHTGTGIRAFNITDTSSGMNPPAIEMIRLTITGGDVGGITPEGGAIRSASLLTLRHCTMINNSADRGGGVFVEVAGGGSTSREVLRMEDCLVEQNDAFSGGGIAVFAGSLSTPTLDTITITRTDIRTNDASSSNEGGGILATLIGGSMTLTNSKLTGNDAGNGGGMYITLSNADLTISDSEFSGINRATNSTGRGGGLYIDAEDASQVSIQRSVISNNSSGAEGGGLRAELFDSSSLVIQDSTISGNDTGQRGGGVAVVAGSNGSLTIARSSITGNDAGTDGGGVFAQSIVSSGSTLFPTPRAITISRSTVSGNNALNRGGGLYLFNEGGTEVLVDETRITDNHVPHSEFGHLNGGGMYAFLAKHSADAAPKFTITRSTVDANTADHEGGGIFVCIKQAGNFVATNTTISGNSTLNQTTGAGGGIHIARFPTPYLEDRADAYLRNLTITKNTSRSGGGLSIENMSNMFVRVANTIISENNNHLPEPNNHNNLIGPVMAGDFKHNLVGSGSTFQDQSGAAFSPDATNILSDAPLLRPLADNGGPTPTHALRYEPGVISPAIDAGSNNLAKDPLIPPPNDVLLTDQRGAGFTRSFEITAVPGSGAGPVDIGAYEIGLAKVIDVIIRSMSGPGEFHFTEVDGSGLQLRTVPVGGPYKVQIHFSEDVTNIVQSSLVLKSLHTGTVQQIVSNPNFYDPLTDLATWQFSMPFVANQYWLSLNDTITNRNGDALDGEWINPFSVSTVNQSVSEFPSGDGIAGGDFNFAMTFLGGDANLNNIVDGSDVLIYYAHVGLNGGFTDGDFSGNGSIGGEDHMIWSHNFGRDLTNLLIAGFNGDGFVDGADDLIWYQNLGSTTATHAQGDADLDGDVDSDDHLFWQRQFGIELDWVT